MLLFNRFTNFNAGIPHRQLAIRNDREVAPLCYLKETLVILNEVRNLYEKLEIKFKQLLIQPTNYTT